MKALLGFLIGCWALAAAHGEWYDELTWAPGNFPPLRPFHAHYHFGWGVVTAAEADFDYTRAKSGTNKITVSAKSIGMVRNLWRMDTQHIAILQNATLRPVSLTQMEAYKDETITTKVQFTDQGVSRTREGKPAGNGGKVKGAPAAAAAPAKVKKFKFAPVYDMQSALQFVRSQPMANGDIYKLAVYPATTPYLAQINVVSRQKLKAAGKSWDTIKIDLHLWKISKTFELEPHENFKRLSAWVSDDSDRVLLRIESEIHVGSVVGELDKLEWK